MASSNKNLSPTDTTKSIITKQSELTRFSGPIPPPEVLKMYNDVGIDIPNRIVAMAEKEQQHRFEMDKIQIQIIQESSSTRNQDITNTNNRLIDHLGKGQKYNYIINIAELISSIILSVPIFDNSQISPYATFVLFALHTGANIYNSYKNKGQSDKLIEYEDQNKLDTID